MSDTSKYYWLRLYDDLFTSKRIKKLRKLGADFFIIYLKMQLLSVKNNGVIEYTGLEDTFAEELSVDIDEDSDKIQITMAYLQSCGLLEANDDEIFLPYVPICTGSETKGAVRVRKHREKKKALQCNADVTNCNTEKEIEKEIESKLDKKKNKPFETYYPFDEALDSAFKEYIKMRKQIKAPMTDRAIELAIMKLDKLATSSEEKIAIINEAIMGNWKSFYLLKNKQPAQEASQSIAEKWANI